MLEKSIASFYWSLSNSIKERKKALRLKRYDILPDPTRISKIVHNIRNEQHPYLISGFECAYLNYLFLCESHEDFINENILSFAPKEHEMKNGKNYDKMLWGHINWDKMFQDIIAELLELDSSEGLGKLFEDTLMDYVPYAGMKCDGLCPGCEKERIRQDAIEWVHLRHGNGLLKQTFYERFSGKTVDKFNREFSEFVSDYLEKRKPTEYSFGLQAYNFYKAVSRTADWYSLVKIQYSGTSDEKSDFQRLLEEYVENGRGQIQKLKEYQQRFDKLSM